MTRLRYTPNGGITLVLDVTHDRAARVAALAYASEIDTSDSVLADKLRAAVMDATLVALGV